MNQLESVDVELVEAHLRRLRCPVRLPFDRSGYQTYRGRLDASDVDRLVLWWQFRRRTRGESCRLPDLMTSVPPHRRTLSFLDGNPERGYQPVDLRTAHDLQLVLLATDLASNRLYIIDGNNRAVAQQLSHHDFQGVPFLLGVHPDLARWDQMPNREKRGQDSLSPHSRQKES